MNRRKRTDEDKIVVNNKKIKYSSCVTCFEDFSTEIFCEIFDYLSFFDTHFIFSNLNNRFKSIVNHSNFSIKLNFSMVSLKLFHNYWTNIVLFHHERIKSLRLTKPSIVVIAYSPISIWSQFIRLENLYFDDILSKCITPAFSRLSLLPCLTSLIIDCFDENENNMIIYEQIFRLPKLKYCRFFSQSTRSCKPLPLSTTELSPIKSLVFDHCLKSTEINSILSYVPQLRHLSVRCDDELEYRSIQSYSPMLIRLTNVSLNINSFQLEHLELMMKNLFNHVEVLRISTTKNVMLLNVNFWEELIEFHLPYLRIFDIGIFYSTTSTDQTRLNEFKTWMKKFHSSFWTERQWFFEDHFYQKHNQSFFNFYSANSYRKKQYAFYKKFNQLV